jgi:hypothetical protein
METQPNWEPYIAARVYAKWCQKNSGHVDYICNGFHTESQQNCMFCDGGLSVCIRCGAFEGATPSECPGVEMTEDQRQRVYRCIIDYRFGQWVSGGTVFMLHAWVSPPPDPVPGFLGWNWAQIEEHIASQDYEPLTVDAD